VTKSPFAYATQSFPVSATVINVSVSSATNWGVGDEVTIGPTSGLEAAAA
jgi:hypothetical protein